MFFVEEVSGLIPAMANITRAAVGRKNITEKKSHLKGVF